MPALSLEDLACRRGGRLILAGLSCTIAAGEAMLLTGRNGSGKTSLLRTLALLVPPAAGTIRWHGRDVRAEREAWHRQVGWLGHSDAIKPELTLREMLHFAAALRTGPSSAGAEAVATLEVDALLDRPGRLLSAGQRRRAALARLAAGGTTVWLMDEPAAALDAASIAGLHRLLRAHLDAGGIAVIASHGDIDLPGAQRLDLDAAGAAAMAAIRREDATW